MLKKTAVLFVLVSYLFTFASVQPARSAVPLVLLAVSAIGTAMAASATGAYYAKNGHAPEYVSAVANAAASAADHIFQPAYLAAGPITLITAASFPNQVSAYLGRDAAVGASLGNIINTARQYYGSKFADLYDDVIAPNSTQTMDPANPPAIGQTFRTTNPVGTYQITRPPSAGVIHTSHFSYLPQFNFLEGFGQQAFYDAMSGILSVRTGETTTYLGQPAYVLKKYQCQPVGANNNPIPPFPANPNYAGIKSALDQLLSISSDIQEDIRDVIKELPPGDVVKAQDVPATGTGTPPAAITPAELQAALAQNAVDVAAKVKEAADARLAADPTNPALQQAADQAALDLARAQGQQAIDQLPEETPAVETAAAPSLTPPERPEFDFQPLLDVRDKLMTKEPFVLLGQVADMVEPLSTPPVAPSFEVDLGLVKKTIDLSIFDPLASTVRTVMSFLLYLAVFYMSIKTWARM